MKTSELKKIKNRRAARVRAKIQGSASRPRLSVFRSNRFLRLQLIDDEHGKTLATVSTPASGKAKAKPENGSKKTDAARAAGESLAKKAGEMGIKEVVFDRGSYRYHGRVQAVAEGARAAGLKL
jgi:large subunit ribosomal protein L18